MRFGVIGCGGIARWHMEAINDLEDAQLAAVCDASGERARSVGESYGIPYYTDASQLIHSADVDAVCICTPSGLHASLAVQALNSGKHVVVEKPLSISRVSLAEVLAAKEASGAKLMVISQLRYSPDVRKAREIICSGRLGRLTMVDLSMKYYRSAEYYANGWRGTFAMDGGGALMNQGIHGVDILRYLCGEVAQVQCLSQTLLHDIEVEDTLAASLRFTHGALGVITATTSVNPGKERRLEVGGTKGSLVLVEDKLVMLNTSEETIFQPYDSMCSGANDPLAIGVELHRAQIEDFIQCVKENREPLLNAHEAKKTMNLVFALYEAAEAEKAVLVNA